MSSLFKTMILERITMDEAEALLQLPRHLGDDPADGVPIMANNGRYGPYVQKERDYRNIDSEDQLLQITLDDALRIFSQPKVYKRGGGNWRPRARCASSAPIPSASAPSWPRTASSGCTSPTARRTRRSARATASRRCRRSGRTNCSRSAATRSPPTADPRRRRPKAAAKKPAAKKSAAKKPAAKKSAARKSPAKRTPPHPSQTARRSGDAEHPATASRNSPSCLRQSKGPPRSIVAAANRGPTIWAVETTAHTL